MMTLEVFNAIAKLLRSRGATRTAARLVLVEGKARKDAMAATGLSGPSVSQSVAKYKAADALIRGAYKMKNKACNSNV